MATSKPNPIKPRKAPPKTAPPAGIGWLAFWPMDNYFLGSQKLKWSFWTLAGLMFIWMQWSAQGTGINGDDKMQNEYEQALINWYDTGGKDTTALNLPKTKMHYYGGFFEVTSGFTNRLLGFTSPDQEGYHKVRHSFTALFGWGALLFIGLTAGLLAGWEAAIIAILFGFLSPRLTGHGVMNPKDIPFATGYIMTIFFLFAWLRSMPRPNWNVLIGLAVGLGMALGVRAGGLILVAIFGLFAVLHFIGQYGLSGFSKEGRKLKQYLIYGLVPVSLGLIITILFWPFAMQSPYKNILESLAELSNYGVNIRLLFNGDMVFAQSLPWDYLPRWVLVTVPLFILLGWIFGLGLIGQMWKRIGSIPILLLGFAFLFPFVYVIYKQSTLYDGWRHLIFPYTVGVVLAALGVYTLATLKPDFRWLKPAILGIVGLLALDPALHLIKNPFISYVYFNPIEGGVKGALGEYETDYWGVSVKQGIEWLESEGLIGKDIPNDVTLASNFGYQLDKYCRKYDGTVKTVYVRYRQRHDAPWDYGLFLSRFTDGSYIRQGSWPPPNTIHTIDVNGTPVLAIVKNADQAAYEGVNAQKQNRFDEAIPLLERTVTNVPKDEVAWGALAFSYLNTNQLDKCKAALDKILEIDPDNITAYNYYGLFYLNKNEIDPAIKAFEKAIELQDNNFFAYYYLANLELQRQNLTNALDYGKLAVTHNPQFKGAYELVANIYRAMGDGRNADAYSNAAAQLK
ncbi:MAG: tetratricopeptide repeat protein [Saprospiraceae bacterium]|nr:tetratricopeptide repeat protein [Saprospiraceae bacterium]